MREVWGELCGMALRLAGGTGGTHVLGLVIFF